MSFSEWSLVRAASDVERVFEERGGCHVWNTQVREMELGVCFSGKVPNNPRS